MIETIRRKHDDEAAREAGWRPPVLSLRRDFDKVFDWFMQPRWERGDAPPSPTATWLPCVDLAEADGDVLVFVELPGLADEDVDIRISGHTLEISGEKPDPGDDESLEFTHCERRHGRFERTIELPDTVDLGKVEAKRENGLLTIRVPKKPSAVARRIEIRPTRKTSTVKPKARPRSKT